MATKRRTIKSRRETISARKKRRSLLNPLQRELDKPLAKSFKEGAAVAAVVAGPGKFGKGAAKITQKIKAIRKARALKKKKAGERKQFTKESKALDKAIARANATDTNVKRAANRAKLAEKANIKALRVRSKASVAKNVAERTALRKTTIAPREAAFNRKLQKAGLKPREKAGDKKLLARAQKQVKAKKQLTIDEAGAIARKEAGITRPAQGASTELSAGNRFPLSRRIKPKKKGPTFK